MHPLIMTDFPAALNDSIEIKLELLKNSFGLTQMKMGPLNSPVTIEFYEKWLAQNYQGTMSYLKDHLIFKKNPKSLNPKIKSVISVAQGYFTAVSYTPVYVPERTAIYAKNNDYHFWLKDKLKNIIVELQKQFPESVFLPYVDSGPVLERDIAYQNGLGWFGKNTCLIHPDHGSLFFLAEILTDLDCEARIEPLPDFCGKCQKCIEVCPTGAIESPRLLAAEKCISYLTIESKDVPPEPLRKKMGDWFFGCDLCQTVCPWNEKVFRAKKLTKSAETSTELSLELPESQRKELIQYFKILLTESNKKIQKRHFGSPLLRAGPRGLKRNALVVIANKKLFELKNEVEELQEPSLKELALWTLQQLEE
jgi:epoxyqueuosine reductase